MKFHYQFFHGSYFPVIPIVVLKNDKKVNTSAIVDSGASVSIFNSKIAEPIELDVKSGEKRIFQGASARLTGYVHNVKMIVAGEEIKCRVAFSYELGTSFNLLGRETVFDKFLITFNEKNKEIIFEPT